MPQGFPQNSEAKATQLQFTLTGQARRRVIISFLFILFIISGFTARQNYFAFFEPSKSSCGAKARGP